LDEALKEIIVSSTTNYIVYQSGQLTCQGTAHKELLLSREKFKMLKILGSWMKLPLRNWRLENVDSRAYMPGSSRACSCVYQLMSRQEEFKRLKTLDRLDKAHSV